MKARDNPFSTDRVLRIRYELQHDTWPDLLARLEHLHYRAAIVGPHGAGKTTLLEDLQTTLESRGLIVVPLRLDRDHRTFNRAALDAALAPVTSDRHIICLDGAEQLTRLGWLRFTRRVRGARGLIITSHTPGLLPTLIECRTTAALLEGIVRRLTPVPLPYAPTAGELFARHRGDLRAALREMYDLYASK